MNRRKRKPQQTDYIALVKNRITQIQWRLLNEQIKGYWTALPRLHQRAITVLIPFILVLILLPSPSQNTEIQLTPANSRVEIDIDTTGLSEQQTPDQANLKSDTWQDYTVQSGDTLSQVFRASGLPMSDLNALVKVEGSDKPLSRIKAGQLVRFKLATDGKLDILQLEKSQGSVMFFRLSDGGFGRSK